MDTNILIARIRQLLAVDKNAVDIYSDLAKKADERLKEVFAEIVKDERRHVALSLEMLSLLEK